jgi:hypothetical protein
MNEGINNNIPTAEKNDKKGDLNLNLEEQEKAKALHESLIKDGEIIMGTSGGQIEGMGPEKKKAFISKLLTLAGVCGVLVGGSIVYDNYTEAQDITRDLAHIKYNIGMALATLSGIFLLAKHEFSKPGSNEAMK